MKTLKQLGISPTANDNETVEQVCSVLHTYPKAEVCDGSGLTVLNNDKIADRILAAHKREMADEKRISDAVIQSLRDKKMEMAGEIAVKDDEIERLRALVKELADISDTATSSM